MTEIKIKNETNQGELLVATYLPDKGLNMISFKKNDLEVIDQSTRPLFDERFAGLGALIGPHFYRRRPETIAPIPHPERFPHIARVHAKNPGIDPFTHGIGRYAPWKYEYDRTTLNATLKGSDLWNEIPLKELEGQDFTLNYRAAMKPNGLEIEYSVVSEFDSVVGLHYYYHLPNGKGTVTSRVKNSYISNNQHLPIPESWTYDPATQTLAFSMEDEADFTFHPFPNPTVGEMLLDTGAYRLRITFHSQSEECSWQLYHPKGASFVCMEPVSAQDPRHANLTVSALKVHLSIE